MIFIYDTLLIYLKLGKICAYFKIIASVDVISTNLKRFECNFLLFSVIEVTSIYYHFQSYLVNLNMLQKQLQSPEA